MRRIQTLCICLLCFTVFSAHANEFFPTESEKEYSVLVNVLAKQLNDPIPSEYEGTVSTNAAQVQVNLSWKPENDFLQNIGLRSHPYYSLRYIRTVFSAPDNGIENVEGYLFMYGSRYFLDYFGYNGPAFGWYSGAAVSPVKGYNWNNYGPYRQVLYNEFTDIGLIGAVEFVLSYTFFDSLIIEGSYTIGWFRGTPFSARFPALVVGYTY
jgi:hypothetical protein